jgi:hypothetical protein
MIDDEDQLDQFGKMNIIWDLPQSELDIDYIVQLVKMFPNDQQLGEEIRKWEKRRREGR